MNFATAPSGLLFGRLIPEVLKRHTPSRAVGLVYLDVPSETNGWALAMTVLRVEGLQVAYGRATFPGLTVGENLRIGGITVRRADRDARVSEVLEQFPVLAERRHQLAGTMSGGQQQMLALGRALMSRPKVLMIDELSLGLAPTIVHELLGTIARLRDEGTSLVVVEQQVDLALDLADRAYFLERGQVRFEGPAADLRGRTDLLRAVFLTGGP